MPILLKRSLTTGSIPTTSSLQPGEVAINIPDGRLYLRQSGSLGNTIRSVPVLGVSNSGSLILNGGGIITGSLILSGSPGPELIVIGDSTFTGSLTVTQGITGSFSGSIQSSISSSYALTASYALNAAGGGGGSGAGFPFSGSAVITGSLLVSGSGLRVTGSTDIVGALTATTKSFLIDHRKLPGKKLVYGVLEGAEHAVYVRGKLQGSNIIKLPEEWEWLVDTDTITVQLTPIGGHQKLYVKSIDGLYITVEAGGFITQEINCYYLVHATRKDVDRLKTVV